jgi:dolichyl-phosphate beta-glucosyltransferase
MPEPNETHAAEPTLSVIIPAYNEARRIGRTLEAIRDYVGRRFGRCELIVVDDGSSDGTAGVVRQCASEPLTLRLLVNPTNRGKGSSVRQGMLTATGDVLLMCDADLSAPIEELDRLWQWLDRGYDIVIGSRDLPEAQLDPPQPLGRRLMAWTFRALRRRLLLPALQDTQCGFKCFRRDVAREIFARQTVNGWLFDCEVLAIAHRLGYGIKEVGIIWRNDPDTRVNAFRETFGALPTLLRIRRRVSRL